MITNETTGTKGEGDRSHRRRRRRRRHQHGMTRADRTMEILIVAVVAVFVLGAGISWIVSLARPGHQPANAGSTVNLSQPENSQPASQAPVVIIQDNSTRSDAPAK